MAAGPFTTSDSLAYEPLTDLVSVLQRDKPDVAVLVSPLGFLNVYLDFC